MVTFKVAIDVKPGQVTAEEVHEVLHDHFMVKLKTEGVAYKFGKIKVEDADVKTA
jgi:transposase